MVFSCEKKMTECGVSAFRHFHQVEVREMAARRNQPRRQQQFQAKATMTSFATGTQSSEGRKLLLAPRNTRALTRNKAFTFGIRRLTHAKVRNYKRMYLHVESHNKCM